MKKPIRVLLPLTLFLTLFTSNLLAAKVTGNKSKTDSKSDSRAEFLSGDIDIITENIVAKVPSKCSVLILDFKDVNGVITHFGRYLADKLHIRLSNIGGDISIIERRNIEMALKEQEFQISGYVDQKTAVRISSLTGATHIVSGIVTELPVTISIDVKILDIERGLVIGGISHEIQKTREVSSLVGTIIKTEEQKQKDLENQRLMILQEIETERQMRIQSLREEEQAMKQALDEEINTKTAELVKLDEEIRRKSIVITDYEKKKKVLEEKNAYVMQIHEQIDKLNISIEKKLKIGMSLQQVKLILDEKNLVFGGCNDQSCNSHCFISGKFFLIFENDILMKVTPSGTFVHKCYDAYHFGINVAPY
jgi:hypothetical protein